MLCSKSLFNAAVMCSVQNCNYVQRLIDKIDNATIESSHPVFFLQLPYQQICLPKLEICGHSIVFITVCYHICYLCNNINKYDKETTNMDAQLLELIM